MKITETTLMVLGNMAKLSQHLVIEAGSKIRSVNEHGTSIIELQAEEEFPVQVAIHDLSGFLKVIGLFNDPEFDFKDKFVKISDDCATQTYYYSDPEELIFNNDETEEIQFGINFKLSYDKFDRTLKAAQVNGVEDIAFVGKADGVYLEASDKDNPTRSFSILVSDEPCGEFIAMMKQTKKIKINVLPIDYDVGVCEGGAIKFATQIEDFSLTYIMALEADSQF